MDNFIVPVYGNQGQHVQMVHSWSRVCVHASCKAFGPNVQHEGHPSAAWAQGAWSCCCPHMLGGHLMAPSLPGLHCWGCCSPVLASNGTSQALPGQRCCSQHLVLASGSSPGVFWVVCRVSGSDVAPGSDVVYAPAQVNQSCCCPQALGSHGTAPMLPGYQC